MKDPNADVETFVAAWIAGEVPETSRRRFNMRRRYAGDRRSRGMVQAAVSSGRRLSRDPGGAVQRANPR